MAIAVTEQRLMLRFCDWLVSRDTWNYYGDFNSGGGDGGGDDGGVKRWWILVSSTADEIVWLVMQPDYDETRWILSLSLLEVKLVSGD